VEDVGGVSDFPEVCVVTSAGEDASARIGPGAEYFGSSGPDLSIVAGAHPFSNGTHYVSAADVLVVSKNVHPFGVGDID
jgi:hypothetical protein